MHVWFYLRFDGHRKYFVERTSKQQLMEFDIPIEKFEVFIKYASVQCSFFDRWQEFHWHRATSLSYCALPRLSLVKF